ncbi:MAG: M48 family metalloprotease [Pseudomonadota bacterium]
MPALFLAACVNPDTGLEEGSGLTSSWVRPDDPQEKIGAREHPAVIAKYGGVYENPVAERMIAVIVGKLVAVSDDPSRVYKVTILNSSKINAFALPGGFLYLTRGLLALANDSSEVAAVIAHEMAHVSANHAIIRQEKVNSAQLGEKVVAEVLENSAAGKIALAANQNRLSQFSREQELQADTIGIRMIGRAGYDPYSAARFLETMSRFRTFIAGDKTLDDGDNFASSHPSTPKRIELARRHARFFGAPGLGDRGRDRYLAGIEATLYGDSAEEGFVRGRVFAHAGLKISFKAPVGFRIENQAKAVLVSGPDDIATRFDAAIVPSRTKLSDYLQSGWITGLVEETIREETVNGRRTAHATALGEGWRFKVRVIRHGSQVYRFITAAPQTNTNLDAVSRQITGSFRVLRDSEVENLKPLEIRVVPVGENDTVRTISSRMEGTDRAEQLFRLINGLGKNDRLTIGQKVKIVTTS